MLLNRLQKQIAVIQVTVICILLAALPQSISAKDLAIGDIKLQLLASAELKYEDNIFLERDDEKEDFIAVGKLHVLAFKPLGQRSRVSLIAGIKVEEYFKYTQLDNEGFDLGADLILDKPSYVCKVSDKFLNTKDRSDDLENIEKIQRYVNIFKYSLRTKGEKWSLEPVGENSDTNYGRRDGNVERDYVYENRDKNLGEYGGIVRRQIAPNTNVLIEYAYGELRYENFFHPDFNLPTGYPDQTYHQVFVGAEGKIRGETPFTLKIGRQKRTIEENGAADLDTTVARFSMEHPFPNEDTLIIKANRDVVESIYDSANYYLLNSFWIKYTHKFDEEERFLGRIGFKYDNQKYPIDTIEEGQSKKREDKIYVCDVGIEYHFRTWEWLKVEASYQYTKRDSNHNLFNYTLNRFSVMGKVDF
ncbi:outer membrane beta-barrel protein [Candidatus Auribacterota bacterium]